MIDASDRCAKVIYKVRWLQPWSEAFKLLGAYSLFIKASCNESRIGGLVLRDLRDVN